MHALIIEDESLIAMTIEDILRECGFSSFDFAASSEEAIAHAKQRCPALITADVNLAPGCGIDAVNAICSNSPIPIIFITGSASEATARMPQHLLIVKPFTAEAVAAAVRLALSSTDAPDDQSLHAKPKRPSFRDGTGYPRS